MSWSDHRNQNVSFDLTAQQKREAEAACLGYRPEDIVMAERKFTEEELENMRMVLAQHERQGIREFDLNNPPKKHYVHQEYPKMMYNGSGGYRVVEDSRQEAAAAKDGWSTKPFNNEETGEERAMRLEAEQLRAENDLMKRGPGRPRKE
jgi:hypothetical protein